MNPLAGSSWVTKLSVVAVGALLLVGVLALVFGSGSGSGSGSADADAQPTLAGCATLVGLLVVGRELEVELADPSELVASLASGESTDSETTRRAQRDALGACPSLAYYVREYATQSTDGTMDSMTNNQVWSACREDPRRTTPVCRDVPTNEPLQPSASSVLASADDPELIARAAQCLTTKGPQSSCPLGWQDALTSGWIGGGSAAQAPNAPSAASAQSETPEPSQVIAGLSEFETPSGDISCYTNLRPADTTCVVWSRNEQVRVRPDGGVTLTSCAETRCRRIGGEQVLPVGSSAENDGVTCRSTESGLTCTAGSSGRGAAMSASAIREVA